MFFLYNLLLSLLFWLLLPLALVVLLLKPNLAGELRERLGKTPPGFAVYLRKLKKENKTIVWINAASVGELMISRPIVRELVEKNENYGFVISTNSRSGVRMAKQLFGEEKVFLLPFDFPWIARRVAKSIQPRLTILVEFEMGPNLIYQLIKTGSKVILINAAMANKTVKMYRKVPGLLKKTLQRLTFIGVQTQEERTEIIALGVTPEKIEVTGNMKFDSSAKPLEGEERAALKQGLRIPAHKQVLIAGSTHPGEEEILYRVYAKLQKELPDLVLIIAPRQIERTAELRQLAEKYGFTVIERTKIASHEFVHDPGHNVIILDTIGELADLYSIATVVFVGGSLVDQGGHNLLEPVIYQKPVLFGPYINDFREISRKLTEKQIGIMVNNEEELYHKLFSLLSDQNRLQEIAERAADLLVEMGGSTQRNLSVIWKVLANSESK
ncbi:MAG TPA: hypothetical protein GXX33_01115 [Firmicutes bacterium]|nr:hypothetical protein [Bacillota bacterium]